MISQNILLNTDSYKPSHWLQYPKDAQATFFYGGSRGGAYNKTIFFGLQYILKAYLDKPLTHKDVDEARDIYALHGVPFNEAGFRDIVDRLDGKLPVRIKAVPEGSLIPEHLPMFTLESTDEQSFWLPSYLETMLLRVWYPCTVATVSFSVRQVILEALRRTSDDPEGQLPFKLHDFGSRGVSSLESAGIGGAAHLTSFMGTDTVSALVLLRNYYHEKMAGYSIPAAEHSTMTAWGRNHEEEAYRNMLKQYAKPGALLAVVSDSYDIYNAVENIWGKTLRQEVIDSGATLVVRPDSGDPVAVVTKCALLLEKTFGATLNSKGYKVLNHVRLIQGDGISPETIPEILLSLEKEGFSADNIAFGMGGGLLQKVNRDTQKFAFKCSATKRKGQWQDTYKDPVTDPGKKSIRGRVQLLVNDAEHYILHHMDTDTVPLGYRDAMEVVWENGVLTKDQNLESIRKRIAKHDNVWQAKDKEGERHKVIAA